MFCISHRNFIQFHSITAGTSNNNPISTDTVNADAPKWLNCPNGTSFGGNNVCPVFRSNSRDIYLIKPKINYFSSLFDDLVKFENMIIHNSVQSACDMIIDTQSAKNEIIIGKLLKYFVCFKIDIDVLKLDGSFNDIFESNTSSNEKIEDRVDNLKLNCKNDQEDVFNVIKDKLIESDFEGAVNHCLNSGRYVDALIIANCGGNDLRSKIEDFILENNKSFHLNLAIHLGRNDLQGFTSTAPLNDWIQIIKVIHKNSSPEHASQLVKVLSIRMINENMHYPALFTSLLAQDFESFVEIVFDLTSGIDNYSISKLIYLFKVIRVIEALKPDSIKSYNNNSTRLKIFEIISKLLSLFLSAGLNANFIASLIDKNFYDNHIKDKNSDIDSFFGFIRPNQSNSADIQSDLTNISNGAFINSFVHQNSKEFVPNYVFPKPVLIRQHAPPPSPSITVNYNDAPIINPKLSKFSPQINIQGPRFLKYFYSYFFRNFAR